MTFTPRASARIGTRTDDSEGLRCPLTGLVLTLARLHLDHGAAFRVWPLLLGSGVTCIDDSHLAVTITTAVTRYSSRWCVYCGTPTLSSPEPLR